MYFTAPVDWVEFVVKKRIYIYIYIERERERESDFFVVAFFFSIYLFENNLFQMKH